MVMQHIYYFQIYIETHKQRLFAILKSVR
uniref:Uncharacterized protein n=1 Tax=Arundo donax TaxID=35708 RepID=A0A0A9GWK3_ARUDO